jgi:hypothetical protein
LQIAGATPPSTHKNGGECANFAGALRLQN